MTDPNSTDSITSILAERLGRITEAQIPSDSRPDLDDLFDSLMTPLDHDDPRAHQLPDDFHETFRTAWLRIRSVT